MFRTILHNLGMASQEEGTGSVTSMEINENGRSSNSVAEAPGPSASGAKCPGRRSERNRKVPGKLRDFVTD